MTTYLTCDEVITLNYRLTERADTLRDFGLLDGAVMRPQQSAFGEDAYPSIHEKAAALMHGIARNHPFVDGNKRTALAATATFYLINGYVLELEAGDAVGLAVDVAEGQVDVPGIASTLKSATKSVELGHDK